VKAAQHLVLRSSVIPRLRRLALGFGLALGLGLGACGGSASETPWPTEPDDVDLGPLGESQREEDPVQKPKSDPDKPGKDGSAADKKAPVEKVDPVAP
jgi:hypothetical protein